MAAAYPDAVLDHWRTLGDPTADAVIDDLARTGEIRAVSEVLRHLVHNEQAIPSELPDSIATWLAETGQIPDWVDRDRMVRGTRLVVDHGPQIGVILAAASLPYCYAAYPDVKVLTFSHRLDQDPYRRVGETAQFVLSATAPGGMEPGGKAIRKVQKIRLLHTSIRHLLLHSERWRADEWGMPINQEALAGTLMSFTVVVLRSLDKLGVRVSPAEADDYLYTWRVIGEMLGIEPELIPERMSDAEELTDAFARRQHRPSEDGALMTGALLEMIVNSLPPGLDGVGPALMRQLGGDELADMNGVPKSSWGLLVQLSGRLGRLVDFAQSAPGLSTLVNTLGAMLLNQASTQMAGRSSASFSIPVPPSLQDSWTASGVFPTIDADTIAALEAE